MSQSSFECFDLTRVVLQISMGLNLAARQIRNTVELLDSGNTIPFIARYRKEATQGLDEIQLRAIEDMLDRMRDLAHRKTTILKTIQSNGQLTEELYDKIFSCDDRQMLELLYLPFKPKRRTRATAARKRGLQPLADLLLRQQPLGESRKSILARYVDPPNDVPDTDAALAGACDIVAEVWADDPDIRAGLLADALQSGQVASRVKRGKKEEGQKFESYFDRREPIRRIPSHRFLGMKRGEAEGVLKVSLTLDDQRVLRGLKSNWVPPSEFEFRIALLEAVEDCYQRLLLPATETTVMQRLKEQSDEEASQVFAKNLAELLLAPPAGAKVTLGIDPGFRTGCKVAVVDETGKFLANETIYPTAPKKDVIGASIKLHELIQRFGVELIAIGNGTASRETDQFVAELLKNKKLTLAQVMVSESGASIYSASELAAREYPDLDLTVRGAISIAHRLQDPLAELVKIDPKSIGVGQYQHDVNQVLLKKSLAREVESCVNSVGVDVNTASSSLLSFVAGIGPKLADRIVEHRDQNGPFERRQQLLNVPKLGRKAFEQSAAFLRIRGGKNRLDNSAVHPESYGLVERMATDLGVTSGKLVGNASLVERLNPGDFVTDQAGLPTINDIMDELAKPGRDPRNQFQVVKFADGIESMGDLKQGQILEGCVTNVTNFGAFVDLGVHQDGLVHISELANEFISDPGEIVSVGDIVKVKVLEVDVDRKRIGLSLKQVVS